MNRIKIAFLALNKSAFILALLCCLLGYLFGNSNDSGLKLICNIAYGYIAGYMFYIPSFVLPEVSLEVRRLKQISNLQIDIKKTIEKIEAVLFKNHEKSEYDLFIFCHAITNSPIRRDLVEMKEDKPMKPEVVAMFGQLNIKVKSLFDLIQSLKYNTASRICDLQPILSDYSLNFESYVKPGVLHGEIDESLLRFLQSITRLKNMSSGTRFNEGR